jgi:hypothetical protein
MYGIKPFLEVFIRLFFRYFLAPEWKKIRAKTSIFSPEKTLLFY